MIDSEMAIQGRMPEIRKNVPRHPAPAPLRISWLNAFGVNRCPSVTSPPGHQVDAHGDLQQLGEDQIVDRKDHQGLDHRPEAPQDGAFNPGFELAIDEAPKQLPVLEDQHGEVGYILQETAHQVRSPSIAAALPSGPKTRGTRVWGGTLGEPTHLGQGAREAPRTGWDDARTTVDRRHSALGGKTKSPYHIRQTAPTTLPFLDNACVRMVRESREDREMCL